MKYILIFITSLLFACTNNKDSKKEDSNIKPEIVDKKPDLKTLEELKMYLLDVRNEKAEILLGKPDVKGRILMGVSYYMVYYDKVLDGSDVKHLLVLVDGKSGIDETSSIYRIEALRNGQTAFRVGNSAQNLTVSRHKLKSNSFDFNQTEGDADWSDVW